MQFKCRSAYYLRQDSKMGKAFQIRGLVHKALGNLELALVDLEQAIKLYRLDKLNQFEADCTEVLADLKQALGKKKMNNSQCDDSRG